MVYSYTVTDKENIIAKIINPESFKETEYDYEFYCAGMFVKVAKDETTSIERELHESAGRKSCPLIFRKKI